MECVHNATSLAGARAAKSFHRGGEMVGCAKAMRVWSGWDFILQLAHALTEPLDFLRRDRHQMRRLVPALVLQEAVPFVQSHTQRSFHGALAAFDGRQR